MCIMIFPPLKKTTLIALIELVQLVCVYFYLIIIIFFCRSDFSELGDNFSTHFNIY